MAGEDLFGGGGSRSGFSIGPGSDEYVPIRKQAGVHESYNPYVWGERDRDVRVDDNGGESLVSGTSGRERDIERYRNMGASSFRTPQIDSRFTNASRAEQWSALGDTRYALGQAQTGMGLARDAAMGSAPSAAEIYGGRLIDDSINSQMAMAASARGGPTAISGAARQAAFAGAQMQQSGARDLAALRADEMARGRDQYLGASNMYGGLAASYGGQAGAIRGHDFQQAYGQAGLEDRNMDRQRQNEQFYEGLAWQTNDAQQKAALRQEEIESGASLGKRRLDLDERAQDWEKVKDIGAGISAGAGSMDSDIRAKDHVTPLGPTGDGGIIRYNPYGDTSGLARQNPYGPAPQAAHAGGSIDFFGGLSGGLRSFSGGGMPVSRAYSPMRSDERTKYVASDERSKGDVMPLYEPPGKQLHQDFEGHGYLADEPRRDVYAASLTADGGSSRSASRPEAKAKPREAAPRERKMTYEEMLRQADELERGMRSDHEARMAQGPAADPVADANRAQQGSAYVYKPAFAAEAGQAPGEMNVGPMAQTMAADPVASTAVRQDPGTGLLSLDRDKLQKLQSAGIGSLQRQLDELRGMFAGRAY